jgi:uncharacterized protein (DUF488 family)
LQIYTIGHSNHTQEEFLDLLISAKIEVLVDIRSIPNSRWAIFANRENLKIALKSAQIKYLYLGHLLGGRPPDLENNDNNTGKIDYKAIQEKESYQNGIKRLLIGLKKYRTCIMCSEEDPSSCHRNLLVAESLREFGVQVFHIRGDGRIQTDEELWKEKLGIATNQPLLPL